jgi:hypothetical protein
MNLQMSEGLQLKSRGTLSQWRDGQTRVPGGAGLDGKQHQMRRPRTRHGCG